MRRSLCGLLLLAGLVGCGGGDAVVDSAPTEKPSNLGFTTVTADDLMNWAEQTYPTLFAGRRQGNLVFGPFIYRHYPGSDNFLGLDNDKVYVMGTLTGGLLQQVGTVYQYACDVKPADCVAPSLPKAPPNRIAFPGQVPVFEVAASGGPSLVYQWYRNGELLPGAVGSSFTPLVAATLADTGTRYTVAVANSKGSVLSSAAVLRVVERSTREALQARLVRNGCDTCHAIDEQMNGPALRAVAQRYATRTDSFAYIAGKIQGGSRGVWGAIMAPNPNISAAEAEALAIDILSLQP